LLVKLLDANQNLSVQVHPGDAYAMAHEGGELGKSEMWYVLHADRGAELIHGIAAGTTRQALRAALEEGRLESLLRRVPVRAGDAVDVPAGTIHALLAGIVVTEIQQNSDTTYRVHDWGRVGLSGKPRPLHVEKALEVIDFERQVCAPVIPHSLGKAEGVDRQELVRNPCFVVEEILLEPGAAYRGVCDGSTLEIWGCVQGGVRVHWAGKPIDLPAIRYALLPAHLGEFAVTAGGASSCLRVYLP
jgi:mannose-6-phosphate isomerase